MACKKKDRFDAGAIAFAGTTTSITLFPPYAVTPKGDGAPFMPKSEIRVQASGATQAGFEQFDEKFTSTTFLETDPPLNELPRSTIFGTGDVPIAWAPGEDRVFVTASGAMGAARCAANDKDGKFSLPRSVVREVLGTIDSTSPLAITVSRERREVRKDKKTVGGTLENGWIELVTSSSESHSFASCSYGYALCGDLCVDTRTDSVNCGACGKTCLASQYCSAGLCR
jgi:hypothetical protein